MYKKCNKLELQVQTRRALTSTEWPESFFLSFFFRRTYTRRLNRRNILKFKNKKHLTVDILQKKKLQVPKGAHNYLGAQTERY